MTLQDGRGAKGRHGFAASASDAASQGEAAISQADWDIRPSQRGDLEDLYAIALATGDAGADATGLYKDPKLIGHIYAAPYALLEPGCALVAQDGAGVAGYIVGARDTPAFEERLEAEWWPTLRPLYDDPTDKPPADWNADEMRAWQIHHPRLTPERITAPYPSHLHINLLPRLQGRGVGRALMDRWLATVKALGSTGAHLGVGPGNLRAMQFYAAYGWRVLEAASPRTTWLAMDL
jgi:GNAT superfamily N-acetyltransferase